MARITVFTAIYGNYDILRDPVPEPGVEYVCFTETPQPAEVWQLVIQEREQPTRVRDARLRKVLAHRFLPNTDVSVWIDGNVQITRPVVHRLCREYLNVHDIAVFRHGERDCIQQEAEACITLNKAWPGNIRKQVRRYFAEGYPRHHGMVETNVLLRRHTDEVRRFNEAWWGELTKETHRDQLSFNYTAWKLGMSYTELPGNVRLHQCPWAHYHVQHGR